MSFKHRRSYLMLLVDLESWEKYRMLPLWPARMTASACRRQMSLSTSSAWTCSGWLAGDGWTKAAWFSGRRPSPLIHWRFWPRGRTCAWTRPRSVCRWRPSASRRPAAAWRPRVASSGRPWLRRATPFWPASDVTRYDDGDVTLYRWLT